MPETLDEQIEEQALSWLMRATSGTFAPEQAAQLQIWLEQDPAHRQAYDEARVLWAGLEDLRDTPVVTESLAQAATQTPADNTDELAEQRRIRRSFKRFDYRSLGIAACLALAIVLAPAAMQNLKLWQADYQTGVGHQQSISLDDGSRVFLNAASALNTEYNQTQRGIELLQGEAEFQVSKDPARPFVVSVDGMQIKALGTDFIVDKTAESVRVSVVESAVQISHSTWEPVVLHAGQQVDIPAGQNPQAVTEINPRHAAAWRSNRLIFEDEALGRVVEEINRYRPGHVFLSRPALNDLRVSGVFNVQDIDALLAVISKTLPINSASIGGRYVVLF